MSRCLPRERRTAEAFGDGLRAHTHVEAVDVLPPTRTASDRFELDVLLRPAADGLPPAVAGYCARHTLSVRNVTSQGEHWQALIVV